MTLQKLIDFLRQKPYLVTAALFLATALLSHQPSVGARRGSTKSPRGDAPEEQGHVLGVRTSLTLPTPAAKPKVLSPAPAIAARSAVVLEPQSHTVLFKKNAQLRLPPASTTKIATAAVALETHNPNKVVTVPEDLIPKTPGAWMGLQPGQQITAEELLQGMLIFSGNDAAFAVAKTHPTGVITAMNKLARDLGLEDTNFINPIGFDNPNHYSSAYDLAVLADYTMRKPKFAEIVGTKEGNTNQLLGTVEGVNGVKTGYTLLARGVLVVSVEREGNKVIVVVMGSDQREADTTALVEWAYKSVAW